MEWVVLIQGTRLDAGGLAGLYEETDKYWCVSHLSCLGSGDDSPATCLIDSLLLSTAKKCLCCFCRK